MSRAGTDTDVLTRALYQYSTVTADDQTGRVARVIRSGALGAIGGTEVAAFERRAADMLGRRGALAVSSATAGLDAIFRALRIGRGDEVIVPELSWVSVGAAVWAAGACPVVAPVGEDLALAWDELEPLVGPQTKAAVLAHMRGMSATDADRLAAGLDERGVVLIEDCAQAWGVRSAGRRGLASVYSTQTYKLVATGEGGIVVTDDEELLQDMRAVSGDTRVATPEPSWRLNHWLGEVQAAMALAQLDFLAELVDGLQALQQEMACVFAASPAIRAVVPRMDVVAQDTNGAFVGLWFHDHRSAAAATAYLRRSRLPCYQPAAEGDLHVARSWPVQAKRSLVDLRLYADVAVPFVEPGDRDAFLQALRPICSGLAASIEAEPR